MGSLHTCQRAGCTKPVEPGRRSYCSDACRDTAQRAKIAIRKANVQALPKVRRSH